MIDARLWGQKTLLTLGLSAALIPATLNAATTEQEAAEENDDMEEVVVSGTRLQNMKAIDARRMSSNVVDAVSASEIGQLPDFNIGEALQRLPGIGIKQDQAEARFVTIRALDASYNYTTVDGVSIAVPDRNGRRVFMDVMPASLADRIDVYKTFDASNEGAAIGGIIDIRTASAFDKGDNSFKLDVQLGKYENDAGFRDVDPSGRANVFYSDIFGDNRQFGYVLTANYFKRDSTIPQNEWGSTKSFYNNDGTDAGTPVDGVYPGNTYVVPGERRGFFYHNDRVRYGLTGKFEVKASENKKYFIKGFWNKATDDEARQTDLLRHSGSGTLVDHTATSGTLLDAASFRQQHYLGQFEFERSVWAITGGADYQFNDATLVLRANYSGSQFTNPENWAEWRMSGDNDDDGIVDTAFSYVKVGNTYQMTMLDNDAYLNFDNYQAYRRQFDDRELDEDLFELKADWSDSLSADGAWRYKTGLSIRTIDRAFDENRSRYLATDTNTYTLAASEVVNNDICLSAPGFTEGQCVIAIDPTRATNNFSAHIAANPAQWLFDEMEGDDNGLDYGVEETVSAAYWMFEYTGDKTEVKFGLRYEDTQVDGRGRRDVSPQGWQNVTSTGDYSKLLPSAGITRHLTDNVLLRAAYSKSLGRPSFDRIAPKGESFNPETLTLSRGNPNLEPRQSENFDIGIDWYIDDGQGLVAANLFRKELDGEFVTDTSTITMLVDGVEEEVDVRQPFNDDAVITINGLELQLVKNLDFIYEGLGFSTNATVLDSDQKRESASGAEYELLTMVNQPKHTLNTSLFYDSDKWSFRIAHNYQSISASSRLYADYYRDRYDDSRSFVNFKVSHRFNENMKGYVNVWNLTGEGRSESQGFDQEIPMVAADFGNAVFVGFSYSL